MPPDAAPGLSQILRKWVTVPVLSCFILSVLSLSSPAINYGLRFRTMNMICMKQPRIKSWLCVSFVIATVTLCLLWLIGLRGTTVAVYVRSPFTPGRHVTVGVGNGRIWVIASRWEPPRPMPWAGIVEYSSELDNAYMVEASKPFLFKSFSFSDSAGRWTGYEVRAPLPHLVFAGAALSLTLWWMNRRSRRRIHTNSNVCNRCGYNLTGLTGERCPECGTNFSKNE